MVLILIYLNLKKMLDAVETPALARWLAPASKDLLMLDNLKEHPSKPEGFYRACSKHNSSNAKMLW